MIGAKLDLCVSVVSGGNRQMTLDCLRSVLNSLDGTIKVEIHFVDNCAPALWFTEVSSISPLIKLYRNDRRKGFGDNHNMVMRSVNADFYLILNDDTVMAPGTCETLVREARKSEGVGFIGPKLLNGDGSLQPSCYRFPSPWLSLSQALLLNRFFRRLSFFDDYSSFEHEKRRVVDYVSGAALLARKEMIEQVGIFDESFFMYAEEADWCLRAKQAGWETVFTNEATIVHFGGQSTLEFSDERSVEFLKSHSKFLLKHFGRIGLLSYKFTTFFKHLPRLFLSLATHAKKARISAERDIVLWSIGLLHRPGLKDVSDRQQKTIDRFPARAHE